MNRKTSIVATVCMVWMMLSNISASAQDTIGNKKGKLTFGGYGEAVYSRNFYSDNMFRYSHASTYSDATGHGRVDIPHAVLSIGYDFGKGWTFGSEIEFEHGGVEAAIEVEDEETGEFEKEIERGGEVALEQFWIQRSFGKALNVRMGHIVVPVGQTNKAHLPTEFFTVYRPEGEFTIMPCTWHETGISVWGRMKKWRYEVQIVPALNSAMFNHSGWIHDGSASAYEFKVANNLAGVLRLDNYASKNLHFGASGYIGNSFRNDIITEERSERYKDVRGTVLIGTFEFDYKGNGFITRGNFDYGYLVDAAAVSTYNKYLSNSNQAPYPHTLVGKSAMAVGFEAGYDALSNTKLDDKKLYIFGRYDYYDSYVPATTASTDYMWSDRHVMTVGLNYYPMDEIVLKAEFSERFLKSQYNNEPSFSIGIAYSGFFIK